MNFTDSPQKTESTPKHNLTVPSDLDENPALELVRQGLRVAENELRDAVEEEDAEGNEEATGRLDDDLPRERLFPNGRGKGGDVPRYLVVQALCDVHALETGIVDAMREFLGDTRNASHPDLRRLLGDTMHRGQERSIRVAGLIEDIGGNCVGGVRFMGADIDGFLASLAAREFSSRGHGVRGLIIAMNALSVGYDVLLTTSVALNAGKAADLAESALHECAEHVVELTNLLPELLVDEISAVAEVPNPEAAMEAARRIRASWNHPTA